MIIVMEVWHLNPKSRNNALEIMQKLDFITGPSAHQHEGWCGHARFYQKSSQPFDIIILYPWKNSESHKDLVAHEVSIIADFTAKYCSRKRDIFYYIELAVEVENDNNHI